MDAKMLEAIEQMKRGEEAGFRYIYAQSYKLVYFYARGYLKREEDINDLVQNVYVALFRSIHTLENPEAFYDWLKMIVHNQAGMILRKFKDEVPQEEGMEEFQGVDAWATTDVSTLSEANAEQKAVGEILYELLEELPEVQKAALMMRIYDEMKEKEIAEVMGCSVNTVRSRLRFAQENLKEGMEKREKKEGIRLPALSIPALIFAYKLLYDRLVKEMAAERIYETVCSTVGLAAAGAKSGGALAEIAGLSKKAKLLLLAGTLAVGGIGAAAGAIAGANALANKRMETFGVHSLQVDTLTPTPTLSLIEVSNVTPTPTLALTATASSALTPTPELTTAPMPTTYVMSETEQKTLGNLVYEIIDGEAVIVGVKVKDFLSEYDIPEYIEACPVTKIERSAFSDCKAIKQVIFPASLREIEANAFYGCDSLERVELPDSVEYVGAGAFSWCKAISFVTLSKNLRVLEEGAFSYCETITSVHIPEGVTALEHFAFGNTGIGQLSLPESLVKIADNLFGGGKITFLDTVPGSYAEEWAVNAGYISNQKNIEEAPKFTYTVKDGAVTITGMDKPSWDHLVIPSELDGYPVKEISAGAFKGHEINFIDISAGVERICTDAFMTANVPVGVRFHGTETKMDGQVFNLDAFFGWDATLFLIPKDSEAEKWIKRITGEKFEVLFY